MKANEINNNALACLKNQEWKKAQDLFFYNARKNPSYQTCNNLGYYLITEGLISGNEKVRNAMKLGLKYLLKSSALKATAINNSAIITAINYLLRDEKEDATRLLEWAFELSKCSLELEYSHVLQYNYLRFSYLLDKNSLYLLSQIQDLVRNYTCTESVSLYLAFLSKKLLQKDGIKCISDYGNFIDDLDKLMFFAKFGMYKEGRILCKSVLDTYAIDEQIASAVIECYENDCDSSIKEKELEEVRVLLKNSICINKKAKRSILIKLFESASYRKSRIDEFEPAIPMMDLCCYFGCSIHKIKWND